MEPQVARYSERPGLWDAIEDLSDEVWPEYHQHGDTLTPASTGSPTSGSSTRPAVARGADRPAPGRSGQACHVPAAAAAVALLALLAGCAGGTASVPGPGAGPMRQALRDWAAFPAGATPRPLVLTGPPVADPASGFPSGDAKLAYLEGALNLPAALPSGPAAAAGFPLITAREATQILRSVAAKGPPVTARLTVTGVRLGTAVFDTDRGPRKLPAWLFGLAGMRDPAGVLAVADSRIFVPRGRAANPRPFVDEARLGRGGRTLTVRFTGAPSGTGPCTASYSATQVASRAAVAVAVKEHAHGGTVACAAVGYPRRVTVALAAPLGGRVLVDAASGVAVTVLPAGP